MFCEFSFGGTFKWNWSKKRGSRWDYTAYAVCLWNFTPIHWWTQVSSKIVNYCKIFYFCCVLIIELLFLSSHIFWIGDLNYRLVDNPPRQVFDLTNFTDIIKYDQLYQEMQRGRVFVNYTEGSINFRPTYKYDPGTDEWDSR